MWQEEKKLTEVTNVTKVVPSALSRWKVSKTQVTKTLPRLLTVTAAQAIGLALDQYPDGIIDSVELDEDDGQLKWKIDLDDTSGNDLADVEIAAV